MLNPDEFSPRKSDLEASLKRVEVVNDYTVTLHLISPFRPFLPQLASERVGLFVSPAAVAKYGGGKSGNYGRNPVGTGPFKLAEWVPGQRIRLEKNSNFWEKSKPYLDAIVFRESGAEASVARAMLRTGEADFTDRGTFRADDLPILEQDPNLRAVTYRGVRIIGLFFNVAKPPFDNKALRQAVSYSIDRARFTEVVYKGAGRPAYTMEETGWAHNPDLKPIVFDLAKAKQKLAEAGYPNGITIPMACISSASELQRCEVYQAMMKQAGINVDIQLSTSSRFYGRDAFGLGKIGFKSTLWSHRVDPHIRFQAIFHSQGYYNLGRYVKPEVDRLINEAAAEYDTAKAKVIYGKIQTIVADDAVWVYATWLNEYLGIRKDVRNYVTHPDGRERVRDVWLER